MELVSSRPQVFWVLHNEFGKLNAEVAQLCDILDHRFYHSAAIFGVHGESSAALNPICRLNDLRACFGSV